MASRSLAPSIAPWRALAAALALGACAPPPSDVRAYLAATANPLDPAACLSLQRADLRGECVGLSAYALARVRRMDEALAACGALDEGKWRSECYFLVSDGRGARGREAHRICNQAGEFREYCLGHAMQREAHYALDRMASGREAATLAELVLLGERYLGPQEGPPRARQLMSSALAGLHPGTPFGEGACGAVDPEVCQAAYEERVRRSAAWREGPDPCLPRPSLATAAAAGLPTWEPAWEASARVVWERLCQEPPPASP